MEDQIIMLGVLSSAVIGINLFILKTLDSLCKRISRLEGRLHSQAWETFEAGLFNITSLIDSHGNRTNWFSWCSDNWNVRHSESWNSCIRSVEKIFSHKVKEFKLHLSFFYSIKLYAKVLRVLKSTRLFTFIPSE